MTSSRSSLAMILSQNKTKQTPKFSVLLSCDCKLIITLYLQVIFTFKFENMVCLTKQQQSKIIVKLFRQEFIPCILPREPMELYKMPMKVLLQRSCPFTSFRLSQIELDQLQFSHLENKSDKVYPRESL